MRIAALDLGSNSFHLVVVDAHADATFEPLLREKEMLRLGDVVARTGAIPHDVADQVVATVARMRSLAESAGADEIVACATSAALREADNSAEVVDRVESETGVRIRVISGKDEARLIFSAVRASVVIDPGPALCIDLGGGSLEVSVGDSGGLLWSTSVKLGVARLTAELVRADPPSREDLQRLRERATTVLKPVFREFADFAPKMLVGSSGTLLALGRMAAAKQTGSVPKSVNHLRVSLAEIKAIHDEAVKKSAADRQRMPGLDARRADLLPAGTTVVLVAMEEAGLDELVLSEWALREGIVLEAIGGHDPVDWSSDPRAMRRASVHALARRCGADDAHARQVERLAMELFDQLVELHRLDSDDRELLAYGAALHDIGEHVSVEGHDKHTAYLIEHGKLRGFDSREIGIVASIGRFHRRGNPKSSYAPYADLSEADQDRVIRMVALLRLADGLDRTHSGVIDDLDLLLKSESVELRVQTMGDSDVEFWGVRRKKELFEKVFERRLDLITVTASGSQPLARGA